MKTIGGLILAAGIILAFYAMSMDVSVALDQPIFGIERVNNIGLMSDRQNYEIFAGILSIIGVILLVVPKKREEVGPRIDWKTGEIIKSFVIFVFITSLISCGPSAKDVAAELLKQELYTKDSIQQSSYRTEQFTQLRRLIDISPNLIKKVKQFNDPHLVPLVKAITDVTDTIETVEFNTVSYAKFNEVENKLISAMNALLYAIDKKMKSDQDLRDFSAQIEGTENRIKMCKKFS